MNRAELISLLELISNYSLEYLKTLSTEKLQQIYEEKR